MFPCSLQKFPWVPSVPKSTYSTFCCSLFPKISETQFLFPCSQLYFPFVPLLVPNNDYDHVPLFPCHTNPGEVWAEASFNEYTCC